MAMIFDLHSHSTASDGTLSPTELVQRAHRNGVTVLALTDHDGTSGLAEGRAAAQDLEIRFVSGVEISATWAGHTIHIVGLGIDPDFPQMAAGLSEIRESRKARGIRIASELQKEGIEGSLDAALEYAGNPDVLSRTHFARHLVAKGYGNDINAVFRRFLAEGKPGYVPHDWVPLENAVKWINASGGVAVVAHPGRYRLPEKELHCLLKYFRDFGGTAIEVQAGSHGAKQAGLFAKLSRKFGFASSCGSDFHSPVESRVDLGRLPALPPNLTPVWERFAY